MKVFWQRLIPNINNMADAPIENKVDYKIPQNCIFPTAKPSEISRTGADFYWGIVDFSNENPKKYKLINDFQDKSSSRYELVRNKINKEFSEYAQYVEIDINKAKAKTFSLAKELIDIPFENISIELTQNSAVKFKVVLDESRLLIINKPFEELVDLSKDEVIFSIFVNRELIISNATTISNVVEGVQKYMSM
jgi:hypothetical protein